MENLLKLRRVFLALVILFACAALAVRAGDPIRKVDSVRIEKANDPAQPIAPKQWLDRVAEFFRRPIINIALITLGVIGLIFEFKLPGTTFPGSVAALCFVLFFWCHSFVGDGGITILAVLLFMLGLVFLAVEVSA